MDRSRTNESKWRGAARVFVPVISALFAASPVAAAKLMVGPGQTYTVPSQAAAVAQPGDTVIIAPSTYHDCAVWKTDNLTIKASAPGVVLANTVCRGKGIFIINGNNVTVEGITFTGAAVPDGNGAGIRAQGANLTVSDSTFTDNQDGILANPNPASTITISGSTFTHNGTCSSQCAHGIYVGHIALLQIDHSRFYDTQEGNHIKSRAASTQISNSEIKDGPNGTASYLVDIPNGGDLVMSNTILEKGPNAQNHTTAVTIGEEKMMSNPTSRLRVTKNTFINKGQATVFVTNRTATPAELIGNTLQGNEVTPLIGPGTTQ